MSKTGVPVIRLEAISKDFSNHRVVDGLDLDVAEGEFFSLLGPSGSGKTTVLRLLAGLEAPGAGRIVIDGADMAGVPPYARPVNMMFQSYALFPHMNVADNVAFGLRQEGRKRAEIKARVAAMLELVQMSGLEGRRPHQLSGGQCQRVALARCLIKEPRVVLLDEPMAALDRRLREQTQLELVRIQARIGITFIMVTHDQQEAMAMSSRIGVMDRGRLLQVDRPRAIYERPASRAVAEFIGTANFFEGAVAAAGRVTVDGLPVPLAVRGENRSGERVTVMVRPEKVSIARPSPAHADNTLEGRVEAIAYHGGLSLYHVIVGEGRVVLVSATNPPDIAQGDPVVLSWSAEDAVVLP